MAANLEINPTHPVVIKLKDMASSGNKSARQFAELLFEVAAVSSGYEVPDPAAFARRVTELMSHWPETPAGKETEGQRATEEGDKEAAEMSEEDTPIMPDVL
jgi:hypothetical protein